MGKSSPRNQRMQQKAREIQDKAAGLSDDIAEFEKFRADLLPQIRNMLLAGEDPKKILELGNNIGAARMVQLLLSEKDSGKFLALYREILDRTVGPVIKKTENKHALSNLPDDELEALLESREAEVRDLEESDDGSK